MSFSLTDDEWERVRLMPPEALADLAADLDLILPEHIEARTLIEDCIPGILKRCLADGLPLSRYDRDDLEALTPQERSDAAVILGVQGKPTVDALITAGERVYKRYVDSPIAMVVPSLLTAILRASRQS